MPPALLFFIDQPPLTSPTPTVDNTTHLNHDKNATVRRKCAPPLNRICFDTSQDASKLAYPQAHNATASLQ